MSRLRDNALMNDIGGMDRLKSCGFKPSKLESSISYALWRKPLNRICSRSDLKVFRVELCVLEARAFRPTAARRWPYRNNR